MPELKVIAARRFPKAFNGRMAFEIEKAKRIR
jgi:hypothetical protein